MSHYLLEHGYVKEYLTSENVLLPGQHYHEIMYHCDPGYKLSATSLGHMFCQQQGWMGVEPYCEVDHSVGPSDEDLDIQESSEQDTHESCENDYGCEFKCQLMDEVPTCICQEGYKIQDVTACVDIDECSDNNGGCEHNCVNKPGTFQCKTNSFVYLIAVLLNRFLKGHSYSNLSKF